MSEKKRLESAIHAAESLHGHLGPFLVIGVKMGRIALKTLGIGTSRSDELRADVSVPLSTPFSCIIDGIQATTQCTIGNRKLKVNDSEEEIVAYFERKNPNRALKIRLIPKIAEGIVGRMSRDSSAEELAREVARLRDSGLFIVET